jgi:SAM-dependent methyltransferase
MDLREVPRGTFATFATSARHPWEVARLRFFARLLRDAKVRARRVLDGGSGDGWFSRELVAHLPDDARVTCFDTGYTDEQLATLNARGDRQTFTARLPRGHFDLLLLMDVLEHVEDDAGFLRSLAALLGPGATALISVPAWPLLFTAHDRRLLHFRRYTPEGGLALLRTCGLSVEAHGGLFHAPLAVRGLAWLYERARGRPDDGDDHELAWRHGPFVTRVVERALALDNDLSSAFARRGRDVPGLSWWALCRA